MESKKWALYTALLIPVFMILTIIGSLYLPRLAGQPAYDFVYKLEWANYKTPRYFIYKIKQKTNTEISLVELQKLVLDKNKVSPDGFEVVRNDNDNGIFGGIFGPGRDPNAYYLKGHHIVIKLDFSAYYKNDYPEFTFLGWIKQP